MDKRDFATVRRNLTEKGYAVQCFDTAAEAAAYLDAQIQNKTVGFGGSVTLEQMGLYEKLQAHNTLYWHWRIPPGKTDRELRAAANAASVYISSVNGLADTGEIVNIDGNCNRIAAILYGHEKVYLIAGENKLAKDCEGALFRARNTAAPLNARRIGAKTPCAARGDRCYDCKSEGRICRGLSVLWEKPMGEDVEVILIHEDLGF